MAELAKLIAITTSFDGACALRGVDFEVRSGEVHALIGENGSGKSALIRVLCGQMAPSGGEVRIDGQRFAFHDPRALRAMSIAIVNQEIALAPDLSVAENIFLGELSHVIAWGALRRRARDLIHALGFDIDPRRRVDSLSAADQQIVKIAKALSRKAKIVVFDEPIAEPSTSDAASLHKVIGKLRSEGVGIVYVSDRLEEALSVSDRVTVLKDGEVVGTQDAKALTIDDAIRMMVGPPMSALFPEKAPRDIGAERLAVRDLNAGRRVRGVSFSLRAGEIVGLGGLIGSGRTEVARAIFRADPRESGAIHVNGREIKVRSPADAVAAGICLAPEDRELHGLFPDMSIRVNATMANLSGVANPFGLLKAGLERTVVTDLGRTLRLKAARIDAPVSSLSAGDQQKVVLAKWLHAGSEIIILDEPTRGLDVDDKSDIHAFIIKLAEAGKAVLVISSEHQELFGLCDRVLVMGEGQLRGELQPRDYSEEKLLSLALPRLAFQQQSETRS
jgi:ribose transport system ATP-binding protein